MWINIEVIPDNEEVVYLPEAMIRKFNPRINVSFGKRNITAKVESAESMEISGGRTFEHPMILRLSAKLVARLQMPADITYKMKFNKESIVIGPVVGFLLGNHNHLYSPQHMEKYSDRFGGIYNQVGGLFYAFSPRAIDWKNSIVYGLYYNNEKSAWQYGKFPFPTVIYRRDFHSNHKTIEKLVEITDGNMFNSWRFTKFYLYQYIKQNEELNEYLPPTQISRSFEQIKQFIDDHGSIILKPISLSRGRGICIIKKENRVYKISDYRYSTPVEAEFTDDESLKEFFNKNKGFFTKYIMQKLLSLADIDGSRFDIRVVMQKEKPSEWKCSGIECRVAAKESLVTNISRGGYALTIDDALKGAFPEDHKDHEKIKEQVNDLCLKLCEKLDETGQHFAEFGMDIAIDEDKNLWIIEVNVFPSFKGFKTMDYETYLGIRHTPIFYASRLAGF